MSLARKVKDDAKTAHSLAHRATCRFALGKVSYAEKDFREATRLEGRLLYSLRGVQEAEYWARRGDRARAIRQTRVSREWASRGEYRPDLCRCDALLARLLVPEDPAESAKHLEASVAFAALSSDVELQLRSYSAACEFYRHTGDYARAITEARTGVMLAETCGFGTYSIDLRIALAETYLATGDAPTALQTAGIALAHSEQADCRFAWGRSDALHLCGLAHLHLGEPEPAKEHLTLALDLRSFLHHGRVEETRRALDCNTTVL